MDPKIVTSLVGLVVFLEFSSDDVVDPDAAIGALEQLGATLQSAPDETRRELIEAIGTVANEFGDKADFVRSLPESLGLL